MVSNTISIRLDSKLKKEAELVLSELGMNMSTAISVYLRQLVRERGIPFQITLKNDSAKKETIAAIEEALEMERTGSGKSFNSIEELRKDLLS